MKDSIRFVKKGLLFLIILLILIFLINLAYTKLFLAKTAVYQQEVFYQKYFGNLTNKTTDFVFFGNSHVNTAIKGDIITNSFSFGSGADNYVNIYYKLNRLLEDGISVKNIVLPVDQDIFLPFLTSKSVLDPLFIYSKFVLYSEIMRLRKQSRISSWIEAHFPVIGNGGYLKYVFSKQVEVGEFHNGWIQLNGNFSSENQTASAELVYEMKFKGQELIGEPSMVYFKKTLELAKMNGMRVIFIKYPLAKEYDLSLTRNLGSNREEYYESLFKEINFILGKNYTIFDYSGLFFNNSGYFNDVEHLNYRGAEIFSKRVLEDMRIVGLA